MRDTIETLAGEMSGAFEGAVRPSTGEEFRRLKDDAPEWMTDVCRQAHDKGEILPDDWRYRFIEEAVDALASHDSPDTARDSLEPDIYTSDLTGWLHSRNSRAWYLDEAAREYGQFRDGLQLLAAGQMREKEETFQQVLDALRGELALRRAEEHSPAILDAPPEMERPPSPADIIADPAAYLAESVASNDNHRGNGR